MCEECPKIETCKEKISEGVYDALCTTGSWVDCPDAEAHAINRNLLRTPKEWREQE